MSALLVRPTDHAGHARNLAAVVGLYFARPNLARLVPRCWRVAPNKEVIMERWYGPLLARLCRSLRPPPRSPSAR
ncbi:MAG: hypothetical protein IPI43_27425 [Sandaracinaceae bacterium]|nr:hypothetical protein [Sandaracinaceae bacterium]